MGTEQQHSPQSLSLALGLLLGHRSVRTWRVHPITKAKVLEIGPPHSGHQLYPDRLGENLPSLAWASHPRSLAEAQTVPGASWGHRKPASPGSVSGASRKTFGLGWAGCPEPQAPRIEWRIPGRGCTLHPSPLGCPVGLWTSVQRCVCPCCMSEGFAGLRSRPGVLREGGSEAVGGAGPLRKGLSLGESANCLFPSS